jgi:hypothetical protein
LADEVRNLLLQVDASVELMRRNLAQGIGSLNQFEREATRTSDQASAAFARIDKAAALARTSIVAFVGGIGIGGIAQLGAAVLKFSADLTDAATQANVSVERYQTLREGLRSLALTTEQTDGVLNRLSETLGAVQAGTASGGVSAALDRMGVTSRILNGEIQTTDQLLDAIAAASTRYKTEAQFTTDVVDVLGRKLGVDFAAAVRDGGAALRESEQAFRDSGAVISDEYVAKLDAADEKLEAFTERSRNRLIIWAADTINYFQKVGQALEEQPWYETLFLGAGGRASQLVEQERQFNAQFGLGGLASRERREREIIEGLPAGSDVRRMAERRFQDQFLKPFNAPVGSAPPRIVAPPRTSAPPRSARPGASAEDRLADARAGSFQGVAARLTAEAGQPLSAIGTELDQIQRAAQRAGEQLATGFQLGEELSRNISRNLAQGVVFGNNIGDALVNSFKAAAAEALANGLFDLLTGGRGGGGIIGTLANTLGVVFGGAFANGGRPPVGRISLVGERGPELFVPDAAGVIIPNNRMGGGGTVINVDARGATDPAAMERAAFTAFLAARQYTDQSFDQRSRVRLARGAGAA